MKSKAYIMLVLNSHMPFVSSANCFTTAEGNWLFETIAETYIPMLRMFERLKRDSIPFKMIVSVSPTLIEMMANKQMMDCFSIHMKNKISLGEGEIERTYENEKLNRLSRTYLERFKDNLEYFLVKCRGDLLDRLIDFANEGYIELITSGATYAFLPFLTVTKKGVEVQVDIGLQTFNDRVGRKTRKELNGFWLPECGYSAGLEYYLEEKGIRYSFLDAHGILFADKKPKYGIYAPVHSPNGVAFFGRDIFSAEDVWSPANGYLSDYSYRDYHSDIGFDLSLDYLNKYFPERKYPFCTGFKYYSKEVGSARQWYDADIATKKAREHAENFVYRRIKVIRQVANLMDRPPLLVLPFDAELFGHLWYEGIDWLESVFRMLANGKADFEFITGEEYLEIYPENQPLLPSFSTWGEFGYSEEFLNRENDWIYRHIHKSIEKMNELAERYRNAEGVLKRALNQAARETLLAQSSDWALMIKSYRNSLIGSRRIKEHLYNFNKIYTAVLSDRIDENWLSHLERKNKIFNNIDYSIFAV